MANSLAALGHLGRWMDREGLDVEQRDRGAVEAFLAAHTKQHGHLPTAGLMPLLGYLRSEGVVAPEPAAPRAPLDRLLAEYREWLLVDRALAPDTVRGHCGSPDGFSPGAPRRTIRSCSSKTPT